MLTPSRARALGRALAAPSTSSPIVTLPSFLVPAFQTTQQATSSRPFSATTTCPSKLGRTPISIPPGVEFVVGEPKLKKDTTTYLKIAKRTVSVTGPLGEFAIRRAMCCAK